MIYEFEGTLHSVGETMSFGNNGFTKRDFVVQEDSDSKYPNLVPFVLKKDRCSLLDNVKPGVRVKVGFGLDGREWENPKTGKKQYFCDHTAIRLSVEDGGSSNVPEPVTPPEDMGGDDELDQMPF